MCGGDIQPYAEQNYGVCSYCGGTMTLPHVSDERRANLFNRANHFRRQNEFDKALGIYESILDENNADAEAHWCTVLCRYGIEYIEDPVSHRHIPTCHRLQYEPILFDADYAAALEYAPDGYSRSLYEWEAGIISEIQKHILAVSQQEAPFDVFICYKEATDGGSRTKDSVVAQDIYYRLTQAGYKVFFARVTLEDKAGTAYEPYIFSALNSARVMLVIGTKPENVSAVWVKNEWSRYLAIMKKNPGRLLIPCYLEMDPYDLPEELSFLQAQDIGKIGFMQDLLHGIHKILSWDESDGVPGQQSRAEATVSVDSLLKRANIFLEDGDFAKADEYFDRVLDTDPECARAYMGKYMAKNNIRSEEKFVKCFVELFNKKKMELLMLQLAHLRQTPNLDPELQIILNKLRKAWKDEKSELEKWLHLDYGYISTSAIIGEVTQKITPDVDQNFQKALRFATVSEKQGYINHLNGIREELRGIKISGKQEDDEKAHLFKERYQQYFYEIFPLLRELASLPKPKEGGKTEVILGLLPIIGLLTLGTWWLFGVGGWLSAVCWSFFILIIIPQCAAENAKIRRQELYRLLRHSELKIKDYSNSEQAVVRTPSESVGDAFDIFKHFNGIKDYSSEQVVVRTSSESVGDAFDVFKHFNEIFDVFKRV
jgi:tetratricopeptide (TPR) repeat protein